MTAICKSKTLRTFLAALMTICLVLSLTVVSAFAEAESATESTTEAATGAESESATTAATEAETGAESESATTAATEAATKAETTAATEAETEDAEAKESRTRGIINLIVGGVILAVLVVLAIVFRKKIPGWYRGVKSECGKIVWCPKDKLKKNTLVVVVIIVALAALIGLLDLAFSEGIEWLGKLL